MKEKSTKVSGGTVDNCKTPIQFKFYQFMDCRFKPNMVGSIDILDTLIQDHVNNYNNLIAKTILGKMTHNIISQAKKKFHDNDITGIDDLLDKILLSCKMTKDNETYIVHIYLALSYTFFLLQEINLTDNDPNFEIKMTALDETTANFREYFRNYFREYFNKKHAASKRAASKRAASGSQNPTNNKHPYIFPTSITLKSYIDTAYIKNTNSLRVYNILSNHTNFKNQTHEVTNIGKQYIKDIIKELEYLQEDMTKLSKYDSIIIGKIISNLFAHLPLDIAKNFREIYSLNYCELTHLIRLEQIKLYINKDGKSSGFEIKIMEYLISTLHAHILDNLAKYKYIVSSNDETM